MKKNAGIILRGFVASWLRGFVASWLRGLGWETTHRGKPMGHGDAPCRTSHKDTKPQRDGGMTENAGIILRGLVAWWLGGLVAWWLGGLVWEQTYRPGTWEMERRRRCQ